MEEEFIPAEWLTLLFAAALFAVAFGVCAGAVSGHHHYIVDVAAGAAIGFICAMAAYVLIV